MPQSLQPLIDNLGKRVPAQPALDHESWELHTQSAEADAIESADLSELQESHQRQIKHYKTLLIRAQSASAASVHELHSRLSEVERKYEELRGVHVACGLKVGEGLDEEWIQASMRRMDRDGRLRLLEAVLEGCHPSEISYQIIKLQQYRRSRFDILGSLSEGITGQIVRYLNVDDILSLRKVCKTYSSLSRDPTVWKMLCSSLMDPQDLLRRADAESPDSITSWREKHWREADAQSFQITAAHTKYITSLCLHKDLLISGSNDETIRIWRLPDSFSKTNSPLRLLHTIPTKSVSCLAYYPQEEVLISGHHDTGYIQIWRNEERAWRSQHILSGHTHGIRAVSIGDRYAVSAGADKAIVVWDWRIGEKVLRWGQQSSLCVALHVFGDSVLSVNLDGIIRIHSIASQQTVAQYRLSDLLEAKEPKSGISGSGTINWCEIRGTAMAVGTKEGIIRLEWQLKSDSASAAAVGPITPLKSKSRSGSMMEPTPTRSLLRTVSHCLLSPDTVRHSSSTLPRQPRNPPLATPSRSRTLPILSGTARSASASVSSTQPTLPRSMTRPELRTGLASSSSPIRTPLKPTIKRSPSMANLLSTPPRKPAPVTNVQSAQHPVVQTSLEPIPDFLCAPRAIEVIPARDTEKGAIGPTGRIAASTRFASRAGAEREIFLAANTPTALHGEVSSRELGGAWNAQAGEMGLRAPEKNPLSIVMDYDKIIYGCADGSLIMAGFT